MTFFYAGNFFLQLYGKIYFKLQTQVYNNTKYEYESEKIAKEYFF